MTDLNLVALDATEQASRVRSRRNSAEQLIEATLSRIESTESHVNAFRVIMAEQALADARCIDALPDDELSKLQLAGVPVAIKDDTDVVGQSTMWGSSSDRGLCKEDAEVVSRLRRAGAVIIGKTNVPELTLWPWTMTRRWGVTRNPWALDRTPGGSSGGSASAVCTGMAAMALGSDGGGSIRYPAGLTGLVGLKPQRNRIPLGPEHASGWHGLIVLGPLTRSVRDAALFLSVVGSEHPSSTLSNEVESSASALRIAVSTNTPPGSQVSLSPARRSQVAATADLLIKLGHTVFNVDIDYGLAPLLNATVRLLKGVQDDVHSMPDRSQLESRTRSVARIARLIPDYSLRASIRREQAVAASINHVFDNADVVITPLCASPAPRIQQCPTRGGSRSLRAANTSAWLVPWNVTGQPAIVIPTGTDETNVPTAVQIVGRPHDESTLLSLASQIEKARPFPVWSESLMNRDI